MVRVCHLQTSYLWLFYSNFEIRIVVCYLNSYILLILFNFFCNNFFIPLWFILFHFVRYYSICIYTFTFLLGLFHFDYFLCRGWHITDYSLEKSGRVFWFNEAIRHQIFHCIVIFHLSRLVEVTLIKHYKIKYYQY